MRSQKLLWSSMLVFALLLPLAFAQGFGDLGSNPWIYFTVNTVILWFVVFVIISLAASKMEGSQKTTMQLGGFAIAAIISWNMVGGSGSIWQVGKFATLFSIRFIVNTVAIGALLYFLAKWVMEKDVSENGNVGLWVIILLFAGIFASKMPYYFWEGGTGRQLIQFLFGSQGILTLNDNRLFIFFSGWLLFSWLFSAFNVGGDYKKLNYILAFVIASNLATGQKPASVGKMVFIGEVIGTIILARNMKEGFKIENGFMHWIIAFILVRWIAEMVFPEHITVKLFSQWSVLSVLSFLAALILITVISAKFAHKEKAWINRRAETYLRNKQSDFLRWFFPNSKYVREHLATLRNLPDREPEVIYRNRLLFMRLLDMELRWKVYEGMKKEMEEMSAELEKISSGRGATESYEKLKEEIIDARSKPGEGWCALNKEVVDLFNEAHETLERAYKSGDMSVAQTWADNNSQRMRSIKERKEQQWKSGQGDRGVFGEKMEFAKNFNLMRARALIFDAYNASSAGYHPYKFDNSGNEVNLYGEYATEAKQGKRNKKLSNPKKDAKNEPPGQSIGFVGKYMLLDWAEFEKDFLNGVYHTGSRNVGEYEKAWEMGKLKDEDIEWAPQGGQSGLAFDMRALMDGRFVWAGRDKYDSSGSMNNTTDPHISYNGLRKFVDALVRREYNDKQEEETLDFIEKTYARGIKTERQPTARQEGGA